jgi:hypothetical protein
VATGRVVDGGPRMVGSATLPMGMTQLWNLSTWTSRSAQLAYVRRA